MSFVTPVRWTASRRRGTSGRCPNGWRVRLGHASLKSTEIYLRADPTEKLNTIESALPPDLRRGVFRVEDRLIAWLSGEQIPGVQPWQERSNQAIPAVDSR